MSDKEEEYKVGPGKPPLEHRFKKGQSGNPKGAAKGSKHIKTVIKEALEMVIEGKDPFTKDVHKKPAQEHLVARLLARALSGDKKAADMLLDRYYGKPTQTIDQNVSVESHEDRLQKIIAAEQERENGSADKTHH